jgi:ribosome-binding protein aMBF1 (putative translation factor)
LASIDRRASSIIPAHCGGANLLAPRQHPDLVTLGDAIRRVRQTRGISQEQLALAADIDRSYLGRIERGDSVVAVLVLLSIAKALGLTLEQLIAEAGL